MKRFIINLFLKLKNQLFILIDEGKSSAFTEIVDVLKHTLSKIEDIYYRHILFPKLKAFTVKEMDQTIY